VRTEPATASLPRFDCGAMFAALDAQRRERELDWPALAEALWAQSEALNAAEAAGHSICPGAVVRVQQRGTISCQYAMFMLRWLDRAPEDFLIGDVADVGQTSLPAAGSDRRLRWDLSQLHAAVNEQRAERGLTWSALANELGCSPSRLTNLRTARLADLELTMRITQWLRRPAAEFIHPAAW